MENEVCKMRYARGFLYINYYNVTFNEKYIDINDIVTLFVISNKKYPFLFDTEYYLFQYSDKVTKGKS